VTNRELLLHSIHNTGHSTTKVAIIPQKLYKAAMLHFSAIHSNLQQYVSPAYHSNVFIHGKKAGPSGQKSDSIPSCTYSAMADRLLSSFNPQHGEEPTNFPNTLPKRHRKLPITYSTAVSGSDALGSTPEAQTFPSVSTITDHDLDSLYQRLLPRLSTPPSAHSSAVTAEELERHYAQCQLDISTIWSDLTSSLATIQSDVAKVKSDMEKQNAIILGMQQEVTGALQDFARKLYDLTIGKNVPIPTATSHQTPLSLHGAATSKIQPWSRGNKTWVQ